MILMLNFESNGSYLLSMLMYQILLAFNLWLLIRKNIKYNSKLLQDNGCKLLR